MRSRSGYISDREVSRQGLEAKRIAPYTPKAVLYCAGHHFSTDAMTGNVLADNGTGHGSVKQLSTLRAYQSRIDSRDYRAAEPGELRGQVRDGNDAHQSVT